LTNRQIDREELYRNLNDWLRTFIRTELQLQGTTKEERLKYIELFEGTKEKKAFFNLFKIRRAESAYWEKLLDRLAEEKILPEETQAKYRDMMLDLMREYKDQSDYYSSRENETKLKRILKDRLYYALVSNNPNCRFGFKGNNNAPILEVKPVKEGEFIFSMSSIDEKQANIVSWLLTSEYVCVKTTSGQVVQKYFLWQCFSLEEATEKSYRILDEFVGFESASVLLDYALL
jgi:hypothetical protein